MSKRLVKAGYNKVAQNYHQHRNVFKSIPYLRMLIRTMLPGSTIWDIGCGSGTLDRYLVDLGFKVQGVDISKAQLDLARTNVPEAEYFLADMEHLPQELSTPEAIISFYTIFHIPRERHLKLLTSFYHHLPYSGQLLVTMGSSEWEGIEDFHGAPMFWSHYGVEKNLELVTTAGFEVLSHHLDRSGGERHQIIFAQKVD